MKNIDLSFFFRGYNKISTVGKVLIFLILFLILHILFKRLNNVSINVEGFSDNEQFKTKTNIEIYDEFYANIYDLLVFNNVKNKYEVGQIIKHTLVDSKNCFILDIGCGTGHHTNMLNTSNYKTIGVDISPSMIKKAKSNYSNNHFKLGDVTNTYLFNHSTFSHALCLYFTIYYIKDKQTFFENCISWLNNGGYLVIHLVKKESFDPILPPGNPLYVVSSQRYAKKRITKTKIHFNQFQYDANFDFSPNSDKVMFEERFIFKNGKVRKHELEMYMEDIENIIVMAQQCGFIVKSKLHMIKCAYENQYLYILQKPY